MNTISRITTEILYNDIKAAAQEAAPLFNLYGWTWGKEDGTVGVPTLNELENTITRLAESALEYFYNSEEEFREAVCASGRFSVTVKEFEDEVNVRIGLELQERSWFKAHPRYA